MHKYLARDQYGQIITYRAKTPRKGLLEALGAKHADKIYRDDPVTQKTIHIGYIVQRRWFSLFQAIERVQL